MSEPLAELLREYRRSLRRAAILRGAALLAIAIISGMAIAAGVDFLFRPAGAVGRGGLTVLALAPAIWVGLKLLVPIFKDRIGDVELARRIELQDPRWRGRLATAAAFLEVDSSAGSRELQERIVADVARDLQATPPATFINRPRLRRAIAAVSLIAVLLLTFAWTRPALAKSGLLRIALPFAAVEWPRAVQLLLLDDSNQPIGSHIQIGRGQTLRFQVRNLHGDVPQDLTLQIVFGDGQRRTQPIPTTDEVSGGDGTRLIGIASLYADRGPLRFRVVGGDDRNMRFIVADVVPPPVLEETTVTITPPAYLRSATERSEGAITTGIVGSTVTIRARANEPLTKAELLVGERDVHPVALSKEARRLDVSFVLEQPGLSALRFRLIDRNGLENDDAGRRELRVVADSVPTVTIVTPANDLTATADAELPVVLEAADDQGLASVRIPFSRDGARYPQAPQPGAGEPDPAIVPLFAGPERPTKGTYPLLWSLTSLELRPGDRLEFHGEATDAFDLGPLHVGRSSPRVVKIVSATEKRDELLDRQAGLLDELVRLHADEKRIAETVSLLRSHIDEAGDLPADEQDVLARSELEQRRIAARLSSPDDSLLRNAAQALSELKSNQLDDRSLIERLHRVVTELEILREGALPAADLNLTEARKSEGMKETRTALAAAEDDLKVVLQSVKALLDDLGAWRSRRDLAAEAGELLASQRELREETAKTAARTLGSASGQLTDQETVALERIRLRQIGLADRLARFDEAIRHLAEAPSSESSSAERGNPESGPPSRAAELLEQLAMPATARAAADAIRGNSLGEAGRLQRQLVEGLQSLADVLTRADVPPLDRGTLREASVELAQLAGEQTKILNELREGLDAEAELDAATRDRLAERQAALRESTAAAARRMRSEAVSEAADSVDHAARLMTSGLSDFRRKHDAAATRRLEAARERLEQAASTTMQQAETLDRRMADEITISSARTLTELAQRQHQLNIEIQQLDEIKARTGSLSRSHLLALRKLVEAQSGIVAETERAAAGLNGAVVVAFALESAVAHMRQVESILGRKETGATAQAEGTAAKARLDGVASVLNAGSGGASQSQQSSSTPTGDNSSQLVPPILQLRLLKVLQEDLYRQTRDLEAVREDDRLTSDQSETLTRLGSEQRALLKMAETILESGTAPPKASP